MIKKIYSVEHGKAVVCHSDDEEEAPLRGSLSYLKVLPPTAELKARKADKGTASRGLEADAVQLDFSGEEKALWGNSSRFVKTKDGKSAVMMGDKIILEQG